MADEEEAQKELKRLRREIDRAKREAKEAEYLPPDELVARLLPTTLRTR
jgi:hypothetical protein